MQPWNIDSIMYLMYNGHEDASPDLNIGFYIYMHSFIRLYGISIKARITTNYDPNEVLYMNAARL